MTPAWGKRGTRPTRHADPDGAIATYLEELRQAEMAGAPTPASALNGLGDAHLDKGDVGSAVDYYRQAAEVYEREGMHDNAIACCKKIRRHDPGDEQAALMLGRYYAVKGLRADAVAELEAYADASARAGRRRDAIEALREVLRIDPDRGETHESLARRLAEEGLREEAEAELGIAMERYRAAGDMDAVQRIRSEVVALRRPAAPVAPTVIEAPVAAAPPALPPESSAPPVPPPAVSPLELEPTSYDPPGPAAVPAPAPDVIDTPIPDGGGADAARLYASGRWEEAVGAYRRLAQNGHASPDDFAAWAESARQAGDLSQVVEALTAAARWNLDHGDPEGARRAAEEMLLLDPDSRVAADILERVGTSLPRG